LTIAAALVSGTTLVVPSTTPVGTRQVFAATLTALAAVSPVQDHLRRLLHSAGRSWDAAKTSGIQVLTVTLFLAVLLAVGEAERPWVPFGVLALANVASASWALRHCRRAGPRLGVDLSRVRRQGSTLLIASLATFSGGYVALALVTAASGPAAAAQVEAVRLLSQPVTVVVAGMLAVLGPRVMTATLTRAPRETHRIVGKPLLLLGLLMTGYVAITSAPWSGSPLRLLVPRAFDVPGLLPAMVVAQMLAYSVGLYRCVPVALRSSAPLLTVEVISALLGVGTTALVLQHGSWAAVWGILIGNLMALLGFSRVATVLLRRRSSLPSV